LASVPAEEIVDVEEEAARERRYRRSRRMHHLMILIGVVAALVVAFALEVRGTSDVAIRGLGTVLPPSCRFRTWTGLDCPSCGLTRAFVSITHGDFAAALQFNPISPLVFGAFLFQIPFRSLQIRRIDQGREELAWPWVNRAMWGLLGLGLVSWFVRLAM
jgi:hypothetical protein